MQKDLQVTQTIELGPKDVALVWNDEGKISAHVSDVGLTEAVPHHVLLALAMMMSMDDSTIVGLMWEKFEKMMDEDIVRQANI
jgi:hypothetical protein